MTPRLVRIRDRRGESPLEACEELLEETLAEGFDDVVAAAMQRLQVVEARGLGEGGSAGAGEGRRGRR
jgi:hypothetical protein